ncbi:hypothetical protein [Methylobacterium nigriterrae]|uniref:hypothetical protein n=1 Tax=Methylobacterium nigriterrae TaxID=3127512 RepID=UPI0030140A5C
MPSRRHLEWRAALSDLKSDRASRPEVREERLRTASVLRGTPALALSAWRGRSGKRYVVGVHAIADAQPDDIADTVALAVRRDENGEAHILSVASISKSPSLTRVLSILAGMGATEMHVHRLAGTVDERVAIAKDLLTPTSTKQLAILDGEQSRVDAINARAAHDAAAHRFALSGGAH